MSGALDPIQEDLPLDLPPAPTPTPNSAPWHRPSTPIGPSVYEQALSWIRRLPWSEWRRRATPMIQDGARQLSILARTGANQASTFARAGATQASAVARIAITRGAPYTMELARSARTGLLPTVQLSGARAVHVVGLPAVVCRAAIQVFIAHRAGLAIDEAVFFRFDDPAAYTVYEAPGDFGLAAAVAYVPTLVMLVLGIVCLVPALAPRAALHLPVTWLTVVQIWLGLSFGAHALPNHEEVGPLAEQARVGASRADPVAVILALPSYALTWITRFGGLLPAVIGGAVVLWLANLLAVL